MKFGIRILSVLIFAALTAPLAEANQGKHEHGGWAKEQKEMFAQLDLSKEQKDQLKEIRKSSREKVKPLKQEAKTAFQGLREAFKNNGSEDDMRKLHKQMTEVRMKLADERFESILAIRKVLTPEQRTKLDALKEEQRKKHGFGEDSERGVE